MKNIVILFSFLALSFSLVSFIPKGDDATVIEIDGKEVGTYTSSQCLFGSCNKYAVKDMSGKILFKVNAFRYSKKSEVSAANPKGEIAYYEWTFFSPEMKVETPIEFSNKKFVKYLKEHEIFTEAGLNEQGLKNFQLEYGMKFSEDKKMNSDRIIIIEN
jgi:hypothetical protein